MLEEERVTQACAYLRMLLWRAGDYRAKWERYASIPDPAAVDEQAVAAVLLEASMLSGHHGWHPDSGSYPLLTRPSPAMVETVRRALSGIALRPDDLDALIRAFDISDRHAHRLRELLRGSPVVRMIYDGVLPPAEVYRHAGPPHYDTLALHELHTVGPDGRPTEHETIQVIRSTVPLLESVPYRFDTDDLLVHMVRGGQVGRQVYRVDESIYGVDILLDQPLALGETTLLQYHTTFAYRTQPPPELRRGVLRTTEDLTIWVRFHPRRLPARVWVARWDRIDQAHIVKRQPAELDSELSVHARFGRVERSIVGFYWEWA